MCIVTFTNQKPKVSRQIASLGRHLPLSSTECFAAAGPSGSSAAPLVPHQLIHRAGGLAVKRTYSLLTPSAKPGRIPAYYQCYLGLRPLPAIPLLDRQA